MRSIVKTVRRRIKGEAPPAKTKQQRRQARKAAGAKPKGAGGPDAVNNYDFTLTEEQIRAGAHRKAVGGKWEKAGRHQFEYLVEQGLQPEHRFLDVGCGSLRGGVHFVRHLEPGNYYGVDVNASLLEAGWSHELAREGLQERLPRQNLRATKRFECDFGVEFDMALAQSLFTHLPLNHIRLCLFRVAKVMPSGARFFATFNERPASVPYDEDIRHPHNVTHTERDTFHYSPEELEWAATVAPWEYRYIGDWGHPRNQMMIEYRRL